MKFKKKKKINKGREAESLVDVWEEHDDNQETEGEKDEEEDEHEGKGQGEKGRTGRIVELQAIRIGQHTRMRNTYSTSWYVCVDTTTTKQQGDKCYDDKLISATATTATTMPKVIPFVAQRQLPLS